MADETITVRFDTSSLRSFNPFVGPLPKRLTRLTKSGLVSLGIPEVVVMEFAGQLTEAVEKARKVEDEKDFRRSREWATDSLRRRFDKASVERTAHLDDLVAGQVTSIEEAIASLGGTVLALRQEDLKASWQAYFAGGPPFKKKRDRKNLPDSVIFEGITREADTRDIVVIVQDQPLSEALTEIPRVRCVKTLEEFFALGDVREMIEQLDAVAADASPSLALMRSALREQHSAVAEGITSGINDKLEGRELEESRWFYVDAGPATISEGGSIGTVCIHEDSFELAGLESVLVRGTIELGGVLIDVPIHKSDWWTMRNDQRELYRLFDDDWNDRTVLAELAVDLRVVFDASISLELGEGTGLTVIDSALESVDEVEVTGAENPDDVADPFEDLPSF